MLTPELNSPAYSSVSQLGQSLEVRSPGGALSGVVIFISRLSFIRLTMSCLTVDDRGESTHGHAGAVIGVDIEVTFSGRCVFTSLLASVSTIFTIATLINDGLLLKTYQINVRLQI